MIIRTVFSSLFGFMAGLACLGFEMFVLFLLNDTRFEPPHELAFSSYPALFGVAFIIGGVCLIPTLLSIVPIIDNLLIHYKSHIKVAFVACGLFGFSSGALLTFSVLGGRDPLLVLVIGFYWMVAALVTSVSLHLFQIAEQGAAANP